MRPPAFGAGSVVVLAVISAWAGCTPARPGLHVERAPSSAKEAVGAVSRLLIRPSRNSPGQPSPFFREGRETVYCTFEVRGIAPQTAVTVHWSVGGREIARSDLVTTPGTLTLAADLASDTPLPTGTYEVEVRIGDARQARTTFRIIPDTSEPPGEGAPAPAQDSGSEPGVSSLTVTTNAECVPVTGRRRRVFSFPRSTESLSVCFDFSAMPRRSTLQVRWLRGSGPGEESLATTTYRPEGNGDLSASFTNNGPLPPGSYAVALFLDDHELDRVGFTIRR